MKLLTWNCQGAFRKKYELIADLAPDLAVIQECEALEKLPWKQGRPPSSACWFGENASKGVGVFSWSDLEFAPLANYDSSIRHCIPLQITRPYQFQLIAVWAMDHPQDSLSYSAQVFQAVGQYREFIQAADTVMMGDFNSSKRGTPRSRIGNHASLTNAIDTLWLISAYHQYFHEKPSQEKRGTFFRGRKTDKISHIDYAYIPVRWLRRLKQVEVGAPETWLAHSDHCPVMVEIQEKEKGTIV
jgi:exodeoxyribonuclease-3